MSLRTVWVSRALILALSFSLGACGGDDKSGSSRRKKAATGEPTTAREKQLLEAKAAGETDSPQQKWGKWRYTGDRGNCFYVAGQKCFKTEALACKAMRCKKDEKCKSTGGGPATVSCAK